jgi:ADP-ribose pyrophosphatase
MLKVWESLGKRELLRVGERLRVILDHVRLPDGREIEDYLQFSVASDAVIVAQTPDGHFVCERQYKHGPRKVILTLPAGIIELGEEPMAAAQRELQEETGYASDDWQFLGCWVRHGNAGGGTTNAFLARGCRKVAEPDSGDLEEMTIELKTPDDLLKALLGDEIPLVADTAALLRALLALGFLVPA